LFFVGLKQNLKEFFEFLDRYFISISIGIWVVEMLFLASWLGVKQGPDSFFFLTIAQKSQFGDPYVDHHYVWYQSYIFLLSIFQRTSLELYGMVGLQVLVASSTLFVVHDLAKQVSAHPLAPKLALFLYVIWVKSHMWHFYIYTDSLFTSCSLWCLWFLCRSKSPLSQISIFPLLIFTCFLRPTGIVWIPMFCLAWLPSFKRIKWGYATAIGIGAILALLWTIQMLPTFELLDSYKKGEIVYCYPAWNQLPPSSLVVPAGNGNSILPLAGFVFQNPLFFLKITMLKALAFLGHVKPFYSWYHNLLIVLFLFPAYYFFLVGLPHWKEKRTRYLLLFWIVFHIGIVSLTAEDWDGRFILPLLPIVWIGAAIGKENLKINKHTIT
jgi:hypothetical protein